MKSLLQRMQSAFIEGARQPACWAFLAAFAVAAAMLLNAGFSKFVIIYSLMTLAIIAGCVGTVAVTEAPPPAATSLARKMIGIKVLLILLCIALSGALGLFFHRATEPIGGFTPAMVWERLASWTGHSTNPAWYLAVLNPVLYCLLPLLLIVPISGFKQLGFVRGHRVLLVAALWCAQPVITFGIAVATGQFPLTESRIHGLMTGFVLNFFQNGLFEEFLFRACLQTMLVLLFCPYWGIALGAVAFGVWHLGMNFSRTGDLGSALALSLVAHAVSGVAFGVMYYRTRNIAAGSILHVVGNSLA